MHGQLIMEERVRAQKRKEKTFQVLVVDDEEEIGILFQRLLGGTQEVAVARDGYEALEKAREQSFDLIFLDVRLPGMDGVETLEQLKQILPDAIVVMMSGYSVEDEVRRALAMGAQDFISKPFENPDQIMTIEQVARYLSLHELTVRRLAREGEIPAFKVGRQWRVKKDLLDRWIEREASRHRS